MTSAEKFAEFTALSFVKISYTNMVIVWSRSLRGQPDMKDHKIISIIYGIFLIIDIILCIGGMVFIPVDTYDINTNDAGTLLEPTYITTPNEDVREFHFRNINWSENGNCLYFFSSHQEITVKADDVILFERNAVQTLWGNDTGFDKEYIEIPEHAEEVTVTVTACYPSLRDRAMSFYQGSALKMIKEIFEQNFLMLIISILNIVAGVILLIYGILMRKRTTLGSSMIYLAFFSIIMGIWSVSDNGITAYLIDKRAACSFISYAALAVVGFPLVMFVHCYLQAEDKYVHKIILAYNVIDIVAVFSLQLLGIRDMKQTVILTHIAMLLACLYLPFSIIYMLCRHIINRRFWVTVCSFLAMCFPLAYSLYCYYFNAGSMDGYGNFSIFIFIAIFTVDVTHTIMKDIDEGKKNAIYQELALMDMLTGCYNRNSYRNDTADWKSLNGVLLLTCDLNNLKQCNDTLGHAFGDKYITDAAGMLKKIFSQHGKVYRIGGDEFCVIIPDSSKCDIEVLLASLTEEERIYNAASDVINMQIACGYSEYNAETDSDIEDIRNRADELMYANKKEIKNDAALNGKTGLKVFPSGSYKAHAH